MSRFFDSNIFFNFNEYFTVAHHTSNEQNYIIMPTNIGIVPPQYSAPPALHLINQYPSHSLYAVCSNGNGSALNIPESHKSMWAINPLCSSNGGNYYRINSNFG